MGPTKRHPRRGMTLLELMLVLALIVALAGLSWPALANMFDTQRLYKAGDQIRSAWSSARNEALTGGRTMLFRYEPAGVSYSVEPWQGNTAESQAEVEFVEVDDSSALAAQPAANVRSLPEGIVFFDSSVDATNRSEMVETSDAGSQNVTATSAPILFYPDGTTSNAQLQLANARGLHLAVQLRGLTGITTIGEVTAANEE